MSLYHNPFPARDDRQAIWQYVTDLTYWQDFNRIYTQHMQPKLLEDLLVEIQMWAVKA